MALKQTGTKPKTRSQTHHFVFGNCNTLPTTQLPTHVDVINYYRLLLSQNPRGNRKDRFDNIVTELGKIWERSFIPTIDEHSVYVKIDRFFTKDDAYLSIDKSKHRLEHNHDKIKEKFDEFNILFNISSCHCYDGFSKTDTILQSTCKCQNNLKKFRNKDDVIFYLDQLGERKARIGAQIDKNSTQKLNADIEKETRKEERKEARLASSLKRQRLEYSTPSTSSNIDTAIINISDELGEMDVSDQHDTDYTPPIKKVKVNYKRCIETKARYKMSDRETQAMINSTIMDLHEHGLLKVHPDDILVGRHAVRGQRDKASEKVAYESRLNNLGLICIKFDGKKDFQTLTEQNTFIMEEHITVVREPDGNYIEHFKPSGTKAPALARDIYVLLRDFESTETLLAVGTDGENKNTGWDNGAIKLLEDHLERPLSWVVCLLHFNERWFTNLFEDQDGPVSGHKKYTGTIGKTFKNPDTATFVKFRIIRGKVPYVSKELFNALSNDIQLLFSYCMAIQTGSYKESLEKNKVGEVHDARWYTKMSKILRLYMTRPNPSQKLIRMCTIIVQVYAPLVFHIHVNWKVQEGAKNVFYAIQLAKDCLKGKEMTIFSNTLLNNSYFCHHEMILLAALFDQDFFTRKNAVRLILKARIKRRESTEWRQFFKPKSININAPSYVHMIDFNALESDNAITEPPLTFNFSDKELQHHVLHNDLIIPDIPCHSQNNERAVQDVSIVAKLFSTYEKRHANLLQTMSSRGKFSKDSKIEDFKK